MISKKYTLREAFEKRLLKSGEDVNIEALYTPYKTILADYYGSYFALSLKSYFAEGALKRVEINRNSNGAIVAYLIKEEAYDSKAKTVASMLLSDDTHNIKATCNKRDEEKFSWKFSIVLNPDIIVRFKGEEEMPYLELPPHTAYTI